MEALTDEVRGRLVAAMDSYDSKAGHYDEIFHEVHDRIARAGGAGKMDIAAVTFWKRSGQGNWIGPLLRKSEEEVRAATRAAFTAENDQSALDALAVLPGFRRKEALATALLCAYDPLEFPVMDRRALNGLTTLGEEVDKSRGMTLRYLTKVRELRDDMRVVRPGTTARDIDKALFVIGENRGQGVRLGRPD